MMVATKCARPDFAPAEQYIGPKKPASRKKAVRTSCAISGPVILLSAKAGKIAPIGAELGRP